MQLEEFRREAHRLVDWMADYLAEVERYPVRAQVKPGEIAAQLPASPPDAAEPFADIIADFERIVLPGMTHWQHPGFFAYFPGNSSPPSVLAEMLTATLGAQCMLWQTSPAATEMETRRARLAAPDDGPARRLCRRDPGQRIERHAVRDPVRARAGDRLARQRGRARRLPEAHLLHVRGSPLLGREGRHDRGPRPAPAAPDPDRRKIRHAPGPARGRDPRRPGARPGAGRRRGQSRRYGRRRDRSSASDRRDLSRAKPLSARRCRLGRQRAAAGGAALDDRGHRHGRQLRAQPAQVAVDQLRLLGAFRARRRTSWSARSRSCRTTSPRARPM